MKVCFVLPSLAGGGAERVAVTVLSGLDGSRHERLLYLFSREGVYFDRLAPDVRVVTATRRSWFGRLFELAGFLRAERPAVVMPFLSYFITAAAAWLAGSGARVIFNQQTPTTEFLEDRDFRWRRPWRRRLFALATRLFYRRADAVVVTSQGLVDDLAANYGVPAAKIRVLHNPLDLASIARDADASIADAGLGAAGPIVAAAGRLAGVKTYPLLIESVAVIAGETPVVAWILGDGVERARLEELASARGLASRIHFLGFQSNPWRFIRRADVFVLTSVYEGFGNVLIEAMACGTPVVATRSRGTSEIVQHEVNGLLVDHEPSAVAGAIRRLLGDGALRTRLLSAARQSVEHYAVPRVVERYERLFLDIFYGRNRVS
jgi:glycosyltransferase involved in cell wall biosynthesis